MAHNAYLADCGGGGDEAHQRTASLSASSNFWVGLGVLGKGGEGGRGGGGGGGGGGSRVSRLGIFALSLHYLSTHLSLDQSLK